jgi:hypothetical protein
VIDRKLLLSDLQKQVKTLEKDLREQAESVEEVRLRMHGEYDHAFKVGRTSATWTVWRDERVTQAAVAWVLGTVFVRFCEDNALLPEPFLAGPGDRLVLAEEAEAQFFRDQPDKTLRDWLHQGFDAIGGTQAGKSLFDKRHNPLYQIPMSHDTAKDVIGFWRRRTEQGSLVHSFCDELWDTRFLGDLYQDLSEHAKKTYALLQTPEFVEEFILDLTLKPAIDEFGYDQVKMIDPTCGSGHFVLGAFNRLLGELERHAPNRDIYERVRLALDAVHGVDINPFAVAIARFRLIVAALRACQLKNFSDSTGYHFPIHLAVGDSLIKNRQLGLFDNVDDLASFSYATEDLDEHAGILSEGKYHVVVGNPPYITVKDKGLNEAYRSSYASCKGKYALSVPFAERFFRLAVRDENRAGFVGQITAASFGSREFGKKLVENFFPTVSFELIVDCSKAFIPGHATSTVLLIGRNSHPRGGTVRAVFPLEGETREPEEPSEGKVWRAIVENFTQTGVSNQWVSVEDLPHETICTHPWTLAAADAAEVLQVINESVERLSEKALRVGFFGITGADELMVAPATTLKRLRSELYFTKRFVVGDEVRDWCFSDGDQVFYPYDNEGELAPSEQLVGNLNRMWRFRSDLYNRATFDGRTYSSAGRIWYSWHQLPKDGASGPVTLSFAEVATHNHFTRDHNDYAFKQTAPVIKFPNSLTEGEAVGILGLLNSSTANFWCRQVCHDKGGGGNGRGIATESWEHMLQRSGVRLQDFPLPSSYPGSIVSEMEGLAQRLTVLRHTEITASGAPARERLYSAEREWYSVRARMIALQEELDWQVYSLYGLLEEVLTSSADAVPELNLGERAFEIVLARKIRDEGLETQWFARHGSTPITEIPEHWTPEYRMVVERRIAVIENNEKIALIERPECKRRWATEGWDAMQAKALRGWLLDRCEARELWFHHVDGIEQPRPLTTAQLADELRRDDDVLSVASLFAPGQDLGKVIADLVADEHVPHLAALRYKDSGLVTRADWENVWDLQRQEDALRDEAAKKEFRKKIPVPPKYKPTDFLKTSYWRQRGKLDVPKERFISYPGSSRDGDPSLLIGWAGWDHREQAQALSTLVVAREQEDGWDADRLLPLLAGLREVLPWVRQWHGEFDPVWGESPADTYTGFLSETAGRLHLTDEAMTSWRPVKATRGRRAKA